MQIRRKQEERFKGSDGAAERLREERQKETERKGGWSMPHIIKEKEMPQLNFNNAPKLSGPPTRVHTGQILHTITITILNFQEKQSETSTVSSGYKRSTKQNGKTVERKKATNQ